MSSNSFKAYISKPILHPHLLAAARKCRRAQDGGGYRVSCYVDDVEHPFRGMVMCHLWADSLAELLAMADRLGVDRKWIQGHPTLSFGKHRNASWVHFDIAKTTRSRAIGAGAILTDRYGPLEHCARLQIASGDPEEVRRGERRLAMVARCRALDIAGAR